MSNKDLNPRLLRLRNEFEIVAENSMLVMGNLNDYRIRFLNTEGVPVEDRPVAAESLAAAITCAVEIAAEIGAADFFITSLPHRLDVGA